MSELKTKKNNASVAQFIKTIENDVKRNDSEKLLQIFEDETGETPAMWGDSIVGFGEYHYKYASGQEGDWPKTGFSPRKQSLTIYIMPGFDAYKDELEKLGKYKTSVSCLYIKKLVGVDETILRKMIRDSYQRMSKMYAT